MLLLLLMLKTVLHNIFVEFVIHFIQDSLIIESLKEQHL